MKLASLVLSSLILTTFLTGLSLASECAVNANIANVYSDIENCDITIQSLEEIHDMKLEMELEHEGKILDKRILSISAVSANSNSIKAFQWNTANKDDGKFIVESKLLKDGCIVDTNTYSFVNGRQVLPRITVDDFVANSEGFSVMITPYEAVLVDVEYMLLDADEVIFLDTVEKVGLHTQPFEVTRNWNTILIDDKQYNGRVKVKMHSPAENHIVAVKDFTAKDDVFISDTYKDEIGASATVDGISQVPFTGSVKFTVSQEEYGNEKIIESISSKSPILLSGDDETVEAIWEERLSEGIYKLSIEVIGNNGDVLDIRETIIEAEATPIAPESTTEEEKKEESPGFLNIHAGLMVIAAIFVLRQNRK